MLDLYAQIYDNTTAIVNVPEVSVNWWAVLLATAAAMAIGFVWYGPFFGKQWLKLVGLKKTDAEKNWKAPMLTMLAMAFVQAFILKHFIVYAAYFYPDMSDLSIGLIVAFWAWVGFVLPVIVSNNMFARRSMDLTKIDASNVLVALLVMGAILAVWN